MLEITGEALALDSTLSVKSEVEESRGIRDAKEEKLGLRNTLVK